MVPKLTEDLRQAIAENGGAPLYLVDTMTNSNYVLLRADEYEKVRTILERGDDFSPSDTYSFVDEVMANDDAYDPLLASYQTLTKPKS